MPIRGLSWRSISCATGAHRRKILPPSSRPSASIINGAALPLPPLSAALILADKSDVRRDRVRNTVPETFDKHDRVNYAALSSKLHVDTHKKVITLNIELDESICSMIDYFEIFSQRMLMCKRAAEVLGLRFKLVANGNKIA